MRTLVLDLERPLTPRVVACKELTRALDNTDVFIRSLAVFKTAGGFASVVESKSNLIVQNLNTGNSDEFNIYRYSFLPGSLFSQQFVSLSQGIFTDNSSIVPGSLGFLSIKDSGSGFAIGLQPKLRASRQSLSPLVLPSGAKYFASQCGSKLEFRSIN